MSSTMDTPSSGSPPSNTELFIGCILAVSGNILISISLNLTKYIHLKLEGQVAPQHYTRQPLWWLALVFMGVGEGGNFAAYGFAPASLVAPLGTTAVIANMFIAVVFLKEKLRADDMFGCAFAVVGAFLLVNFSQKAEQVFNADQLLSALTETGFLIYCGIEVIALVVLFILKYRWNMDNVLILLLICSLLASFTVIASKGLSGMLQLTIAGTMQLDHAIFWAMCAVMAVTCTFQIKYLNQAMQLFDATIVVPTNFVFFTISAIIAGIIFYKEFWGMTTLDIFMFLFGCVMCFVGVYFITSGRADVTGNHGDSDDDESDSVSLKDGGIQEYLPTWLVNPQTSRQNSRTSFSFYPTRSASTVDSRKSISNYQALDQRASESD